MSLLLAEAALRVIAWGKHTGHLDDLRSIPPTPGALVTTGDILRRVPNRDILFQTWPNLDVWFTGTSVVTIPKSRVQTNADGWRTWNLPKQTKHSNECRVVALGDSRAFGWGVGLSDRWSTHLEEFLNSRFSDCSWKIFVLAVPAYNLHQLSAVYQEVGRDLDANFVIYYYSGNDHCLPGWMYPPFDFFSRKSLLWELILSAFQDKFHKEEFKPFINRDPRTNEPLHNACSSTGPTEYLYMEGPENMNNAFHKLRSMTAKQRVPLIVVSDHIIPNQGEWCESDHVWCVNLHAIFYPPSKNLRLDNHPGDELVISSRDTHLSAKGHKFFAEALWEELTKLEESDTPFDFHHPSNNDT